MDMCMQEGKKDETDELDDEDDEGTSSRKPIRTTFELNDTLFAEAELEETDTVYLWLGVSCLCYFDQSFENPYYLCRRM